MTQVVEPEADPVAFLERARLHRSTDGDGLRPACWRRAVACPLAGYWQLFNKKIRGFAYGERQVVRWPNFSSAAFEEEITGAYSGRERWPTQMNILKHPARTSVYADPLQ